MKTNILLTIAFVIVYFISSIHTINAQIEYAYDNSGNRIVRQVIILKSADALIENNTLIQPDDHTIQKNSSLVNYKNNESEVNYETIETEINGLIVTVFPNPTSGELIVKVDKLQNNLQANLKVFNMNGQVIEEKIISTEYTNVSLSAHPNGSYILKMFADDKIKEWKIIKR